MKKWLKGNKERGGFMDLEKLNEAIEKSGISITFIADAMNISRQQLYKKLAGETEFKVSEVNCLFNILKLSYKEKMDIFLS